MLANPTSPDWVWPFATNEASRALLDVFRFSALLRAYRSKSTSVRLERGLRLGLGLGLGLELGSGSVLGLGLGLGLG